VISVRSANDSFQAKKETIELKNALRNAKSDLQRKNEELADIQEELASLKETSKEREKALKIKLRDAAAERDKLIGIEVCSSYLLRCVTITDDLARRRLRV